MTVKPADPETSTGPRIQWSLSSISLPLQGETKPEHSNHQPREQAEQINIDNPKHLALPPETDGGHPPPQHT